MSRFLKPYAWTVAAALLALLAVGVNAADVDPKLEAVRTKVSGMFEFIDPEHVNQSPMDGWYTIQKGSIVA